MKSNQPFFPIFVKTNQFYEPVPAAGTTTSANESLLQCHHRYKKEEFYYGRYN
jgi:hypothetical protein